MADGRWNEQKKYKAGYGGMDYMKRLENANRRAGPLVNDMKRKFRSGNVFYRLLYRYVLIRLMLPEDVEEENLYRLCMMGIQQQKADYPAVDAEMLEKQLEKYDCHQQNAPTQKKILLVMRLEKELGCRLSAEEASRCETLRELAAAFREKLMETYDG